VAWVAILEFFQTLPQRFLDNAAMWSSSSGDHEHIKRCPDIWETRVVLGTSPKVLIHLILVLVELIAGEDLQCDVLIGSGLDGNANRFLDSTKVSNRRSRPSQTVDELPKPSLPSTWYRDAKTSPMLTG